MKLIFNDATEITVQQVEPHGDYLRVLTVGNTPSAMIGQHFEMVKE